MMAHAQLAVVGHQPDFRRLEPPLAEHGVHFGLARFLGDQQHALLRFGEHQLIGRHAGFALRNAVELDLDAHAAAASHLAGGTCEAGGAHILNARQ